MKLRKFSCGQCGLTTFATSILRECQNCGGTMETIAGESEEEVEISEQDLLDLMEEMEAWLGEQEGDIPDQV